MCTVSWSLANRRLELCFNRDERKTRPEAIPPQIHRVDGIQALAPTDPSGGGSWISVNEKGVCLFLLNNYAANVNYVAPGKSLRSRGEIPMRSAGYETRDAVEQDLSQFDAKSYAPFILGVADVEAVQLFVWDGEAFNLFPNSLPMVTTSSFKSVEVQVYRENLYRTLIGEKACLGFQERKAFHTEVFCEDPAFDPMMLRRDSKTHSVTQVSVEAGLVSMSYQSTVGETRSLSGVVSHSLKSS